MSKGRVPSFRGEIGLILCPSIKRGSHAVRRGIHAHAFHERQHGHVGDRLTAAIDENVVAAGLRGSAPQYLERPRRQRHNMLDASFHARGRDRPRCGLKVEFFPRAPIISPVRAADKTRSSSALAATPSRCRSCSTNAGNCFIADCLVMTAHPAGKVSVENLTPRRVKSLETVQRNCIVEDRFAAPAQSGASFWRFAPNRQKEIENHLGVDRLNRKLADGLEGNLQGRMPLRLVLVALELLNLVGLQKLLGDLPEGHDLERGGGCLTLDRDRVAAIGEALVSLPGSHPCLSEAHGVESAQAHGMLAALPLVAEAPASCSPLGPTCNHRP